LKRAALTLALFAVPRALRAEPLPASVEVTRPDEPIVTSPDRAAARRGAGQKGARLPAFAVSAGPGCASAWYLVGPLAWICGDGAVPSPLPPGSPPAPPPLAGLPYAYHFVGSDGSFGYRELETAEEGVPDAQLQPGFGVAIARLATKPGGSEPFGWTTHRLWVPMRDLGAASSPPGPLAAELADGDVAWVNTPRAAVYGAPGARSGPNAFLTALTRVAVFERVDRGHDTWLRIGDAAWVRARDTTFPVLRPPPAETRPDERWLDVDLERQVLVAYRGAHALFALPVSTGRGPAGGELATPRGLHRVWIKLRTSDMDNLENLEAERNYAIQSVPWVMYFDHGYGLHGAFWHRAFGRVQSHGCVNLTPADAERLFDWSSPRLPTGWSAVFPTDHELGTLVRVQ
jgi:hypothetical protein